MKLLRTRKMRGIEDEGGVVFNTFQ